MRCFKLLFMGGIVLALAVPASALTWNVNLPVGGPTKVRLNIIDWTMGKTYYDVDVNGNPTGNPVSLTEGVGAVNALGQNAPAGVQTITKAQTGLGGVGNALVNQTEDIWGVVQVQQILDDTTPSVIYWDNVVDPNSEIVGLIYGGVDTMVIDDLASGLQRVSAAGLFVDFYEQPKGTFDETLGSGGRLSFDEYEGVGKTWNDADLDTIVDPGEVSDITGSRLLLAMESTDGDKAWGDQTLASDVDADGDSDGDFRAQFSPGVTPGTGNGNSWLWLDLVGGAWADPPDPISFEVPDNYWGAPGDPGSSTHGDVHAHQQFTPYNGAGDWLTDSDDPTILASTVIPEPVTMAGLMIGVSSLLGYVRRRRK